MGELTARSLRGVSVLSLLLSVVVAERVGFATRYDVLGASLLAVVVGLPARPLRLVPRSLTDRPVPRWLTHAWPVTLLVSAVLTVALLVAGRWPALHWMYNAHWLARIAVFLVFAMVSLSGQAANIVLATAAFILVVSLPTGRRSVGAGWVVVWATSIAASLVLLDRVHREARSLPMAPLDYRRVGRGAMAVVTVVGLGGAASAFLGSRLGSARFGGPLRNGAPEMADTAGPVFSLTLDTGMRFAPTDRRLLWVRAPAPALWRGQSFDFWDGRRWTTSGELEPMILAEDGSGEPLAAAVPQDPGSTMTVPTEQFPQAVTMVADGGNLVFAAAPAQTVTFGPRVRNAVAHYRGRGAHVVQARDGDVVVLIGMPAAEAYGVVSARPVVTPAILRSHNPSSIPPDIAGRYLQLPSTVTARVRALAASVGNSAPLAYDKVLAFEAWMKTHTRYTLDLPPLPRGSDTVDQFLFADRRGYCQQIASSLAVLLRLQGVPARLAVGFAPGRWNAKAEAFDVRESDSHAWVEVWFPGIGWQGFDPTAEVPLSGEAWSPPVRGSLGGPTTAVASICAALLLLGAGAWFAFTGLRRRRARPWTTSVRIRLEREGARRGRPRAPQETLREYVTALRSGPLPDNRLVELAEAMEQASFGRDGGPGAIPDKDSAARARRTIRAVAAAHPSRRADGRRTSRTGPTSRTDGRTGSARPRR